MANGGSLPFSHRGSGAAFTPPPQQTATNEGWMESSGVGAGSGIGSSMRPRSGSTPFFTPASQQLGRTSQVSSAVRKGSDPGLSRLAVRDAARDLPPELQGVSVKELVKALGEWTVWPGLWVSCFLLSPEGQSPMFFFYQGSKSEPFCGTVVFL